MAMEIPTERRPVSRELGGQSILIYGPPKVGKTTWANGFPETLFESTEDGQRFIDCYPTEVRSWEEHREFISELKGKKGRRFKTIAVDTVDMLWTYCCEYVGKKHGFDHPSDEDYGKGYQMIKDEFRKGLNRLLALGKGVILISHAMDREVKTRVLSITKTMPTLPKSARDIVLPLVSVIVYAGFKVVKNAEGERVEKRVAICRPSEVLEAGDRTGRLPGVMPLRAKKFLEAYRSGASASAV